MRKIMQDNNLSFFKDIRKLEEQGLGFSTDKRTLVKCMNKALAEIVIPNGVVAIGAYAL